MQRIGKVFLLPSVTREGPFIKTEAGYEDSSDDDETFKDVPLLDLPPVLQSRLMDHQKIGVRWLHSLFLSGSGGILGDDMGLGKTFQVICLLAGLMQEQSIQRVLILAPVSVLPNWQRELVEHLQPHIRGLSVHMVNADLTKKKRLQLLDDAFQPSMRGYAAKVVLSSYQLVSNMIDDFANRGKWDYVILDEGHVIKNPSTKTSKSMQALSARHRLILTGTPIQNNLNEFWAIANWATKGKRFGTLSSFKADFTLPIVAGQNPKATEEERHIAEVAARNLLALTKPILLQRKKCELPPNEKMQLPTKVELVVWAPLATSQRALYEEFLQSRQFDMAVHRSTCPVEVINHLKTVCRHPLLIEALEANRRRRRDQQQPSEKALGRSRSQQSQSTSHSSQQKASYDGSGDAEDEVDALGRGLAGMNVADSSGQGDSEEGLLNLPANATVYDVIGREPGVDELLRGSIKLRILLKLLHRLHFAGHRTLVFSQSRLMLDIIQRVLAQYRLATHRIDGSVKSAERQRIIDEFNDTADEDCVGPSICLLTTKACGFGITLTGADRVVIYDPSWNPAEDRQAVDRAYRIGQTKPVVVYRLIMASSVEEKMYEKQVFKDGVRVVTESGTSSRYFSKDETTELFTLGPLEKSEVMERLWKAAGGELRAFPDTRGDLPSVLGYSRHDTLYTEVRPGSQAQGKDAYAQFTADGGAAAYVPSDSDDENIGVPPTPGPHGRQSVVKPPRKYEPVSAVKAGKENNSADYLNATAPHLSFTATKSRYSEPFNLLTPPPEHQPRSVGTNGSSSSAGEFGVDRDAYAELQASKLYSPDKQSVAVGTSISKESVHRLGGFLGTPARDNSFRSPPLSAPRGVVSPPFSGFAASPAHAEGVAAAAVQGAWDASAASAYDSLRSSKLHPGPDRFSPFASPSGSKAYRFSMPDRVSMLTEPSMYGDECDVFGEVVEEECADGQESDLAEENKDQEEDGEGGVLGSLSANVDEQASLLRAENDVSVDKEQPDSGARGVEEVECEIGVSQDEEVRAETASCAESAASRDFSEPSRCFNLGGVKIPQGQGEESSYGTPSALGGWSDGAAVTEKPEEEEEEGMDGLEESVPLSTSSFVGAESVSASINGDLSAQKSSHSDDATEVPSEASAGMPEHNSSRRKTLVLPDNYQLADSGSEGGSDGEGEGGALDANEDNHDNIAGIEASPGMDTKPSIVLLEAEGWSDEEDENEKEEEKSCAQSVADRTQMTDTVAGPNSPSDSIPAVCNAKDPVPSLAHDQVNGTPSAGDEPVQQRARDSVDHSTAAPLEFGYGSEDDESGCFSEFSGHPHPHSQGSHPPHRSASFLLNNLCEMGSMKRTASENSSSLQAPLNVDSSAAATATTADSTQEPSSFASFMPPTFLSPVTPSAPRRGESGEGEGLHGHQREHTAGITVRKQRAPRLSNYMEPDIFASPPPWMAPALFSPDARAPQSSTAGSLCPPSSSTAPSSEAPACVPLPSEGSPQSVLVLEAKSRSVDEEIADLNAQVRTLSLASEAAGTATPPSKISFQTAAGAFSNMVVKAQSVAKAPRAFAVMSDSDSDSCSDSDGDDASSVVRDGAEEEGTGDAASDHDAASMAAVDTPLRSSSSPVVDAATDSDASNAEPLSERRCSPEVSVTGSDEQRSPPPSPGSPRKALFIDDDASSAASVPACKAGDCNLITLSPVLPSNLAPEGQVIGTSKVSYFKHCVVQHLPGAGEEVMAERLHTLRQQLGLPLLQFLVEKPAQGLSSEARDEYSALLQQAREHEGRGELGEAARAYCAALHLCDEDASLHGKLAWMYCSLQFNEE